MIDYSQYGQALIIQQLITPDTPRIVIDIGANDGVAGSNSRTLLEQGWRGVLVEPLPLVYEKLKSNSAGFPNVDVENRACSDSRGTAVLRIGSDGSIGQMSSLSQSGNPRESQQRDDHSPNSLADRPYPRAWRT